MKRSRSSPSSAANDGAWPARTACAPRTIIEPAAWRKMCVSAAVGTSAGRDQLGERLAGADRRELVGVADQHDVGPLADGAQQRDQQLEVGHRGLVDDQQVALQRVLLGALRPLAGDPAERRVHGRRVEPGGLG